MKVCTKCKKEKKLNEFSKRKKSSDSLDHHCKECKNKASEEWRKQNKDKIKQDCKKLNSDPKHKEKMRQYYLDNEDAYKKRSEDWKKENKDRVLEYNKIYFPKRYKNNIQYKIGQLLRSKLYFVLRGKKRKSFMKYLGCTLDELKIHLEKQFLPEMNWLNHGEIWEIDHIEAIANFDLTIESEKEKCFYYTNLMPRFKTTKIAEQFGSNQIGNRNKGKKLL